MFLASKLREYFPLFLAFGVMSIYTAFVILVFTLESKQSIFDWLCLFGGSFSILMLFWSLYKCNKTNPGYIPTGSAEIQEGLIQFCNRCHILKVERSHHCSKCRRCVLNMDHHCVWVDNCIGLYNRKFFNLILIWGSIGMTFAALLAANNILLIYYRIKSNDQGNFVQARLCFTFLIMISQSMNGIGLIYFAGKNVRLVLRNMTTLDELGRNYDSRYNVGYYYNWKFYFGNNPLLWLVPVGKPLGNGYVWDTLQFQYETELIDDKL
ncbi:hypothetical protein pb186bvf_007304 [Paramecium bursaria]